MPETLALGACSVAVDPGVNGGSWLRLPDGTTWPNPADPNEVEWRLRYGNPTREDILAAASVMNAYGHLVFAPERRRREVVRMIRRVIRDQ